MRIFSRCWILFFLLYFLDLCSSARLRIHDAAPLNASILIGVSTVTLKQGPIICRGLLFDLLAYLEHYCHLYLPCVWKAMQFRSAHKHSNKEQLHTSVPQPVECRATIARYVGPLRGYHVIRRECGSMLALRGHSEDQASPPPLSSIVLLPLAIKLNGAPAGSQRGCLWPELGTLASN